ncbi:MAG TPA: hypothetical protein VI589_06965 [Vicinamibacteria bacterium]
MTTPAAGTPYNPLSRYTTEEGLKRFTNSKLQSAIDAAVASAGDAPVVVVAHHVYEQDGAKTENVTKASILVRLPAGFSLMAAGYKDWQDGNLGAEARVVWKPF